jgi:hypothetical protein
MKRALTFFALVSVLATAPALAQKPFTKKPLPSPTPTPAPAPLPIDPNTPKGAPAPSTPNSVNGIAVGSPIAVVDAKCKEAGVRCSRSMRRINASNTLGRVRLDFAAGEFSRVFVTEKGGTVLAIKGRYRTADRARHKSTAAALGPGAPRRGTVAWAPPASNGVVTELDARGQWVLYVDTKAANAKSVAVTTSQFLAAAPRIDSLRPASTTPLGPPHVLGATSVVGGRAAALELERAPTAQVTNPLKIPVRFFFDDLKCWDENDLTSWFHGDDPYLKIVGTHTGPYPLAWQTTKKFSDVESGNNLKLNTAVFTDGDPRRSVTIGEAVGAQFTLLEEDITVDDEIDFAYPIVDYAFAFANQGKTLPFTEVLSGDGGVYTVAYRIEIGTGAPDPNGITGPGHVYRATTPQLYAGNYAGSVGDGPSDATLSFLPSRDPTFPAGVLYGTFRDGGVVANVRTIRLQGDSVEMFARYPSGSPGTLVGYLVGSGADLRIVGTITRDGVSRGVALTKK